ncbi:MAG: stage III sporulation protein AF [Firmicutes bacterium]|nr:stage III sporulation protein AF [Bacillota bacterium]
MLQWLKELIGFLMFAGLFLMLMPNGAMRKFARLITGLLLVALMLQPFIGSRFLLNKDSIAAGLRLSRALTAEQSGMLEVDRLQKQAERLIEKGSSVMREQMVNQTNKQLSSLLSLFPGVKDAKVAAQIGVGGGLERVVVHLYLDEEGYSREHASQGNGSSAMIEPVAPVLIIGGELTRQDEPQGLPWDSLASRVQTLVADFYGLEPEAVIVSIAG